MVLVICVLSDCSFWFYFGDFLISILMQFVKFHFFLLLYNLDLSNVWNFSIDQSVHFWHLAFSLDLILVYVPNHFQVRFFCNILRVRWESSRSRTKERALVMMEKLVRGAFFFLIWAVLNTTFSPLIGYWFICYSSSFLIWSPAVIRTLTL